PYRINSSGIFKNTDCYSNLQVTLTYSFWEKCKTCNKDF
ncbi:MAG: porin family protein, partial [Prevotella sp.]|nr:porin family protein [Prevotella sp.]